MALVLLTKTDEVKQEGRVTVIANSNLSSPLRLAPIMMACQTCGGRCRPLVTQAISRTDHQSALVTPTINQ